MKKMHLLRHAKSSWDNTLLADIDRPLNKRGVNTCEFMAAYIYEAGCQFTNVFCSPAVRAQSTIEIISDHLSGITFDWQVDDKLYSFDSRNLHQWCSLLDESISEILIVGHNPALTDFSNELSSGDIRNIPTCGYVQLTSQSNFAWQEISETRFELTTFLKPKELMT